MEISHEICSHEILWFWWNISQNHEVWDFVVLVINLNRFATMRYCHIYKIWNHEIFCLCASSDRFRSCLLCVAFLFSANRSFYCETQPPASIGWVALSSLIVVPHRWHLLSSPLYDVSNHTNHIFSVRIWSWQHVSVNISSVAELSPVSCCLVGIWFECSAWWVTKVAHPGLCSDK